MPLDLPSLGVPGVSLDLIAVVLIGLYALNGIRRGFIAGMLGLVGMIGTVVLAFAFYQPAADAIRARVPEVYGLPLPGVVANVAGFFAVLLVAQIAFFVIGRIILLALAPVRLMLGPLAMFERLLGVIPSAAHGAVMAAVFLAPFHLISALPDVSDVSGIMDLLPLLPALSETIDRSAIASAIANAATTLAPQMQDVLRYRLDEALRS